MTVFDDIDDITVPVEKIHRVAVNEKDHETWRASVAKVADRARTMDRERRELLLSYQTNPWLLHQLAKAVWEEEHPNLDLDQSQGLDPKSLTSPVTITLAMSAEVQELIAAQQDKGAETWGEIVSRLIGIPGWPRVLFSE